MKIRGTQESIPFIEIGKTNVYIERMLNISKRKSLADGNMMKRSYLSPNTSAHSLIKIQ